MGCILLGFGAAGLATFIIGWIASACGESQPSISDSGWLPLLRTAPLSRCDAKAVTEYFGSYVNGANADSAQPLPITDLISLLGGAGKDSMPAHVRLNTEGGYRLQL